jgi:ribosomal protein L37AE/L43A
MSRPAEAEALLAAVESWRRRGARLMERVRAFYYELVLTGRLCPRCSEPELTMVREGLCRCRNCHKPFDPTVAFQPCTKCGGSLRLRVRRYACARCGTLADSRFVFDATVLDAGYFRRKIAESRKRQQTRRKRIAEKRLAQRSAPIVPEPAELGAVPGLVEALEALSGTPDPEWVRWVRETFDLKRYERALLRRLGPEPVPLERLVDEHADRLERVWRVVAAVFLAQSGAVHLEQHHHTIRVSRREADGERQAVPRGPEAADAHA